MEEFDAVRL